MLNCIIIQKRYCRQYCVHCIYVLWRETSNSNHLCGVEIILAVFGHFAVKTLLQIYRSIYLLTFLYTFAIICSIKVYKNIIYAFCMFAYMFFFFCFTANRLSRFFKVCIYVHKRFFSIHICVERIKSGYTGCSFNPNWVQIIYIHSIANIF